MRLDLLPSETFPTPDSPSARIRVRVRGAVQGVGFRPFVYRLASELALRGSVRNDSRGVLIEVEGTRGALQALLTRLERDKPPLSMIHSLQSEWLEPIGYEELRIERSAAAGDKTAVVLPDAATCADCVTELFDPDDRRYRYPFINCTNCGPRFSIVRALPYDRPHTTMRGFEMCPDCLREYQEPADRRFHAQPNACPQCGPQLELLSPDGSQLASREKALDGALVSVRRGKILALKGLGGFHLVVDARNEAAVQRLRRRKGRPHKPLAIMVAHLDGARTLGRLCPDAATLLASPQAPIVLLCRLPDAPVAESVAPGNPWLGVMLPYTPLHHLLLGGLGFPIVATSGNLSDEPICTDNSEALARLGAIADVFLVHDRPIARHVDDSVVQVHDGSIQPLRRARGLAPYPVRLRSPVPVILALGGQLKNTVALSVGDDVFISQHIGDLETPEAIAAFERVIGDLLRLYEATPVAIAHDLHPDYCSTRWARAATCEGASSGVRRSAEPSASMLGVRLIPVQHHHAHLAACLADNQVESSALGVTWDGTGYGIDGTIWGGEFLCGDAAGFRRVASLRAFRLPGGDAAIRRPAMVAAALLWELLGEAALSREDLAPIAHLSTEERTLVGQMLHTGFRAPETTSAGRLFDGIAALLGLRPRVSFEGQAAMALEFVADPQVRDTYPLPLESADELGGGHLLLDWRALLEAVLEDLRRNTPVATIAARFHNALAQGILEVSRSAGEHTVALTGGCFQNRFLVERTEARLRAAGLAVLQHHQVPPNDAGISLGQIAVAAAQLRQEPVTLPPRPGGS